MCRNWKKWVHKVNKEEIVKNKKVIEDPYKYQLVKNNNITTPKKSIEEANQNNPKVKVKVIMKAKVKIKVKNRLTDH